MWISLTWRNSSLVDNILGINEMLHYIRLEALEQKQTHLTLQVA